MGNLPSIHHHCRPSPAAARVILWDGTVHRFDGQITAAELMLEHPQQVVVEFDPAADPRKRAAPLPADRRLDTRKIYLMLPVKGGKPVSLSSEGARRALSAATSILGPRSLLAPSVSGFLPLLARMCTAGVADDEVPKKDNSSKFEDLMTMAQNAWGGVGGTEMETYLSRQVSGKGWKPSLDTIVEKKVENRVSHWLFSS
ncbi:hypothetical protein MLD38_031747 [Melastoma candidum]|uniref:Uncharacterized protein n=1 Tax=Melastoma candidum TaxID=119954 RepID=A0ACB9MS39_9MYRT|nr:hypothetical protein MLD38_031747 [Melastoma candidum]